MINAPGGPHYEGGLAKLGDVAELLTDPDLAALQDWDDGYFHQLAQFSAAYGVHRDPAALETLLARFDDPTTRERRARALHRNSRNRRTA